MPKFRVGQKVRLVKPEPYPAGFVEDRYGESVLYGKITTITAPPYKASGYLRYPVDIYFKGENVAPIELALVPLYDGDEPASWETCAWRPRDTFQPTLPERLCDLEFEPRAPSS